jgi:dTDP-glucose 4,6-dehydratase
MTRSLNILVTGGCGFIGSELVRQLCTTPHFNVTNLDALTYAATEGSTHSVASNSNYSFVKGDIRDKDTVHALVERIKPDVVFHLAAESHVDRSITGPDAFVTTNVVGTLNLLNACHAYWQTLPEQSRKDFRFLHISTDEVFGSLEPEDAPFSETHPYQPRSPYAASKAGSDHLARAWFHTYGMPVIVTNCSNNYGPYQFPEKLIPLAITNALAGKDIPIYGDGKQVRDWIYVGDHVKGLIAAWQKGQAGETYCFGANQEAHNIDIVRTLCAILDRECPAKSSYSTLITHVTDRLGHDTRYAITSQKAETELGWKAQHALSEGLEKTVAWYLAQTGWWTPLKKGA